MNHYIYQITNNINGKIYIGKRSCKCDINNDKYFGSGIHLKSAIKKYGKQNFTKNIIDICDSSEMAYELEALIVDEDFIKRSDTYNICIGGKGVGIGKSHPNFGKTFSDETKQKISDNHVGMIGKNHSEETRLKISNNNAMKGKIGKLCHMFGKHHSDETREKMSKNSGMKGKTRSPETIAKYKATRSMNKLSKGLII